MRDHLMDLVGHTFDLGVIDLVKIIGTEKETQIRSIDRDQTVVIEGKFSGPIAEFVGEFGMPNIGKLKILLNLDEYREDAKLTIQYRDNVPDAIDFENAAGDFQNTYRFMAARLADARIKKAEFNGAKWNVEFEPSVASIQRLKWQAQANAEQPMLYARTENGDLKFYFGDHTLHEGNFVFQSGVKGTLKHAWLYPIKIVTGILDLVGDKTVHISDEGAIQITVNSGLAVYNYILPGQTK